MKMEQVLKRSLTEHRSALDRGEYSAVELTRAYLSSIEQQNRELGAFLYVDAEGALESAGESDRRIAEGSARSVLEGIPYSLKDNISAKGLPMTCASRILEGYVAPYDATVTDRLRRAGAVLLGKNNMDEFAMGSTGELSAYGAVRNPVNASRVSGDSSSGSAAAVAAGLSAFSLGTDTGGSVRQPAAFCGVLGLKPTYGLLSRYGVAAMASSLDCVGLLAHSSEDCRALLSVLSGRDARDATSFDPVPHEREHAPLRVAVVGGMDGCLSESVGRALEGAARTLEARGARCRETSLHAQRSALAAYTVIAATEASCNLSRYDGIRFGRREAGETLTSLYENSRSLLGDEVVRRILFGIDMLSGDNRENYYLRALRVREEIGRSMRETFAQYDLILSPVAPTVAFPCGTHPTREERRFADTCTVYASLSGLPAISVPVGHDRDGLPLAVQLCAAEQNEELLLSSARVLTEGMRHG